MTYEIPIAPFPENVGACFTLREGGYSSGSYRSFNLGLHVGDKEEDVYKNRTKLLLDQKVESILWLNQVHGINVVEDDPDLKLKALIDADASYTSRPGIACAIMVADCLPVLISNRAGTLVGAAHAGWRGLCSGVIPGLLTRMAIRPEETVAWLGPCISQAHFEVGFDVLEAFQKSPSFADIDISSAFKTLNSNKYQADLQALAKAQLNALGVMSVYRSNSCVYSNSSRYFSYRREKITGRMAALIWLKK